MMPADDLAVSAEAAAANAAPPRLTDRDGSELVAWLWEELSAVIGLPVTAAIVRRAVAVAAARRPELAAIEIRRERLTYTYRLPEDLGADGSARFVPAYRALLAAILALVGELTGGMLGEELRQGLARLLPGGEPLPAEALLPVGAAAQVDLDLPPLPLLVEPDAAFAAPALPGHQAPPAEDSPSGKRGG